MSTAIPDRRRVERTSHAIYGLIIITATLVAEGTHATDALVSLAFLWGAALVLVLAHIYAALVAELGQRGDRRTHVQSHVLVADNVPVAAAVLVPTHLLVAAWLGIISVTVAVDLSIILSLGALFALGAYQARRQGASLAYQLGVGAIGGTLGIIIIVAEVALAH